MKLEENRAPDPKEESAAGDRQEIMEIAMRAGHILLENGAEISRVEETIDRICRHYGIQSANSFVLSNGIFSTMGNQREEFFARVQHIPVSGPAVLAEEIEARLQVRTVGTIAEIQEDFYAISVERRITHPCVLAITRAARGELFHAAAPRRRRARRATESRAAA